MRYIKHIRDALFRRGKDVAWIALNQLVVLVVNFVLLKILTAQMTMEAFGYYSLCLTTILFVRQVIFDPISIVTAKKLGTNASSPEAVSDGFAVVRLTTDRLIIFLSALGLISWCVLSGIVGRPTTATIIFACFLYLAANGAQGIYLNGLNSVRRRVPAALFSILDSTLKLGLVSISLRMLDTETVYVLIAMATGAFIVLSLVRRQVRHVYSLTTPTRQNLIKGTLLLAAPLLIPSLLTSLRSVGDRWILVAFTGVEELAAFSVLYQLGYAPMLLVMGVIQTYIAPKVYSLSSGHNRAALAELENFINKLIIGIAGCTAAGAVFTMFFADVILRIFTGGDYYDFAFYLPLFIAAGAMAASSAILHLAMVGVCETSVVGRLMTIAVMISTGIAILFIILWGFSGAVLSLLCGSAATAALYWLAFRKAVAEAS